MTDQPDELNPLVNVAAEQFIDEVEDWPELSRCQITYVMNVRGVDHLGEALDVAATSLMRYGMDSFYILATDPDTGREWVVHGGQIVEEQELDERYEEALAVEKAEVPVAPEVPGD